MCRRAVFALVITGCVSEVHPEYHPVTSTTYVQNITYATTIVQPPARIDAPPPRQAPARPLAGTPGGTPVVRYRAWSP